MLTLKIENPITNKWEYADMFSGADSVIALKFEANPIGELKHRKADTSNLVKLPRTPHNNILMGFAAEMTEDYGVPYKRINCRVEADGITIFGKGSFFQLVEVTNQYYQIKIYSGIANFFTTIKERKLNEILESGDDGIKHVDWSVLGVKKLFDEYDMNDGNVDTVFPIIDWSKDEEPKAFVIGNSEKNTLPSVDVQTLYPCVKLRKLLELICRGSEPEPKYKLELGDLEDDPLFNNTAVPCVKGVARPIKLNFLGGFMQKIGLKPSVNGYYDWKKYANFPLWNDMAWVFDYVAEANGRKLFRFTAPALGDYNFKIRKSISPYYNSKVKFSIYLNEKFQKEISNREETYSVRLKANDMVDFEVNWKKR